jgi:hypothetical protein
VKKEPIKEDPLEFINNARNKWTELLLKNLEAIYLSSKREEEDETSKESKLYIYDETHLLTYL